jgi:tRNA pseudouridine55 synthase
MSRSRANASQSAILNSKSAIRSPVSPLDHFLVLDKPLGISSAAALNRVKRLLPRGTKLGHAGTLDPLATGVLVCLVGKATKRSDAVMGMPKQYEGVVRLGATSATDDAEGPIESHGGAMPATREAAQQVLQTFVGQIEQMPPAFSALKIDGRRACDRVRDGQTVELKPRLIRVDAIELLDFAPPDLRIRVDCGKGTYIRSLARDIGAALSTGGYLAELRRTRVGPFDLARSATLDALQHDGIEQFLIPAAVIQTA